MQTNEEINVIESVGHIDNLKRLLITVVTISSPVIAYYAGMLGIYAVDYFFYFVETGRQLPINISPPSPYPWYYMSLSAGVFLGFVWIAIGIKYLKGIK